MAIKINLALLVTSVVAGLVTVASFATKAIGFTGAGIAAASKAAFIQSSIGNVAAGSTFAVAQSLAAKGVISTVGLFSGIGCGVVALFGGFKLFQYFKRN
jgi:hypothetical protein